MTIPEEQSPLDPTEVLADSQLPFILLPLMQQMTDEFRAGGAANPLLLAEQFSPVQRTAVLRDLIRHHLELRGGAGQRPRIEDYAGQCSPQDLPMLRQVFESWQAEMLKSAGVETPADGDDSSRRVARGSYQVPAPRQLEVQAPDDTVPRMIGAVRIEGVLGRGGFGQVLLGFDTELEIYVAVKLPRRDLPNLESACRGLIREASRAAQLTSGLRGCGVVGVRTLLWHNEVPAIVMDLVDGPDLGRVLKSRGGRLPPQEAVGLLKQLCVVLQHTHEQGCVHRDLKPQNLLLDAKGVLWLTDFGLAQREWERRTTEQLEGTIPYMSPEQWQGELVDGRTDVWSLGVIMYQMLSGQRPFQEPDIAEKIRKARYVPLKQRDGQLPLVLSRICEKCLRKSLTDRYSSTAEILEHLEEWERSLLTESGAEQLAVPSVGQSSSQSVVSSVPPVSSVPAESESVGVRPRPRGLQSYGPEDEQFFLQLLPGEVEPDGLPKSLHFWRAGRGGERGVGAGVGTAAFCLKTDFRVGVIHGRSGCGKSSFLKAGLLPRLTPDVQWLYLAATADKTEELLLQKLLELYPQLQPHRKLSEVFRHLRDTVLSSTGGRLLIVLDQFEQWLDQHVGESSAEELTDALRHAHRGCLQVLLVVREEFWSPTQEFFSQLDERLDTGRNDQHLHLFSEQHARRVLIWFGQWFQQLPQTEQSFEPSQQQFLSAAVAGLSSAGWVVPVRLAVFCEMFREHKWTLSEFERLGGTEAIEQRFLRDQFSGEDAPQKQRQHLRAAMLVLESLLPATGSEIRGGQKSRSALCRVSGYVRKPSRFAELLGILEADLKLVTRVEQPESEGEVEQAETYYMLTHDFLVNSIRPWVAEELQRTAAGRAEAVLRERDQLYRERGEAQQLPTLREWWQIRRLTDHESWTESQQQMLRAAGRLHLVRGAAVAIVVSAVLLLTVWLRIQGDQQRAAAMAAAIPTQKTSELAEGLVPLQLLREYALPTLQKLYRDSDNTPEALLHLAIARLQLGDTDADLLPTARDRALECRPEQLLPLTTLLQPWAAELQPELQQIVQDEKQLANTRLHAACLLAAWEPDNSEGTAWSQAATAEFVAKQLAAQNPVFVGAYQEVLRPKASRLKAPLTAIFADATQNEVAATIVTGLLADYARADLLPTARDRALECRPEQLLPLTTLLQPWAAELQPELQQIVQDEKQLANTRLHAACLLAAWEPDNSEGTAWSQAATAEFVAGQLAAQNPVFVGAYQEVLRPKASRLKAPLAVIFADATQNEVAGTIVTGLLADYARDDIPVLAQLLLTADPVEDKLLFPLLQTDRAKAIAEFQTVLQQQLKTDWADPPLNAGWSEPAEHIRTQFAAAHGVINERFAFCMDMPLPQLLEVVAALKSSGYRPTRLRPVVENTNEAPRMSAVWVRDGGNFAVHPGLTQAELPKPDENATRDGLLLADLAFVAGSGPQSGWLTVWSAASVEGEERRCLVAVDEDRLKAGIERGTAPKWAQQKLNPLTISVHNDADGNRLYSAVYSSAGAVSEVLPSWPGHERLDLVQRDIAATASRKPQLADPRAGFREQLEQIAALPAAPLELPEIRFTRATALYQTDQLEAALTDLDWLSEKLSTPNATVLQYRSLALARLQRREEAEKVFAEFMQTAPGPSMEDYVAIQMLAAQKDPAAVAAALDAAATRHANNIDDLYNIACAAALSSSILRQLDVPAGATQLREQAIKLLTTCVTGGYSDGRHLSSDADFAELHADHRFVQTVSQLMPADRAAGVWNADPTIETMQLRAKSAAELQTKAAELLADAWRPVSAVLDVAAGDQSAILLLQRPLIADARKETLSIAQGAAAVALLRLEAAATVWPLLESQPDPRLRSEILHRLSLYGADGSGLLTQLRAESDAAEPQVVSRRRSLIQGLGELAAAKLLPEALATEVTADLLVRFAQDPDAGVHGMCEWTLRQLGATEQLLQAEQQFRTGDAVDGRRWYVTKSGGTDAGDRGLSFVIVDATEPFLMGSPLSEAERWGGPNGYSTERRHSRRIGRVVAIGMHEVTVSQFLRFRQQHDVNRTYSPTPDCPVNTVSWYDAAAYCNWLSEQDGLDSSEWCYEPGEQGYAAGMRIKPNFTELRGYRLPTEAEWERACRDTTVTARYFGETDRLLPVYGEYTKNSGFKSMLPVSTLRPNGTGAFGMYGNALEWCQDLYSVYGWYTKNSGDKSMLPVHTLLSNGTGGFGPYGSAVEWCQDLYSAASGVLQDSAFGGQVSEDSIRVLRGGSFDKNDATFLRSAERDNDRPGNRSVSNGFRVSRTYDLRP